MIGCGDIAQRGHLPAIERSSDFVLTAVCELDEVKLRSVALQHNVPCYRDFRRFLAEAPLDAVTVATSPTLTPAITIDAIRAGLNVLCEKPMALSMAEATDVARVAADHQSVVQVGFKNRFSPLVRSLRSWIAEGRLGAPLLFVMSAWDERFDPADMVHFRRIQGWPRHGSVTLHESCHMVDYVSFLGTSEVTSVQSMGITSMGSLDSANYAAALLTFDNGNAARIESGWLFPQAPPEWFSFRVLGPLAIADLNRPAQYLSLSTTTTTTEIRERLDRPWNEVCFDLQLAHFAECIQSRARPETDVDVGVDNVRIVESIEAALRRPAGVEIPEPNG